MSGKPKRPGWGGYRPGAGSKPKSLTDKQVRAMLKTARKYAKKYGKTVDDILLGLIYAREDDIPMKMTARERIGAIKVYKEFAQAKTSEQNITVQHQTEPAISLPAIEDDPGLTVVSGGKV